MYIGQDCLVQYPVPNQENMFKWHKAIVKSIEGETITVIWEEGSFAGLETHSLPLDIVIARGDIASVKQDVGEVKDLLFNMFKEQKVMKTNFTKLIDEQNTRIEQIRTSRSTDLNRVLKQYLQIQDKNTSILADKLDGVASRLDKLNENLDRSHIMNGIFDDEVNYDLNKLKSSLESLGSVHMYSSGEEQVRNQRYVSTPEMPTFGRYNNTNKKQ